jgi:hypothetical protein
LVGAAAWDAEVDAAVELGVEVGVLLPEVLEVVDEEPLLLLPWNLVGSKVPHFAWISVLQASWPVLFPTLARLQSVKACWQMN